jgi:hypothetical protein
MVCVQFRALSYGIVHVALGVGMFLSLLRISGSLGLHYYVGHQVSRKISLILISSQIDSKLWLLATFLACLFSLTTILLVRLDKARYVCLFLGNFLAFTLYFFGIEVWAFLLSLVVDLAFLFSSTAFLKTASRKKASGSWALVSLMSFLLMIISVQSVALASSLVNLLFQLAVFGGIVILQRQLSDLFFNYSSIILLVDIFLWIPLIPIVQKLVIRKHGEENQVGSGRRLSICLLACAVLLACFIAALPYVSGVGRSQLVGVDTPYYYNYLKEISNPFEAVTQIANSYVGLYVLLLFGIRAVGLDTFEAVVVGPAVLAVLFTVAVYLLTQSLTESYFAAGIGSVYGAVSFHTLVGMFAGIFANWLALSFVMFLIFFLNRSFTRWNWRNLLGVILMSYLALVAHPWTWAVMTLVILTALLYLYLFDASSRSSSGRIVITFLASCVLPVIFLATLGGNLIPALRSDLVGGYFQLVGSMSFVGLSQIEQNLMYTLRDYGGGFLTHPQTLLLMLLGIFSLPRFNRRMSAILISWLAVTSVLTVFSSQDLAWRVLYLIPFELFAALGTLVLLGVVLCLGKQAEVKPTDRYMKIVSILVLALLILDCVNFAFKSIALLPVWS